MFYFRPINSIEKKQGSRRVVEVDKNKKEINVDVEVAEKLTKKKYNFDRVRIFKTCTLGSIYK